MAMLHWSTKHDEGLLKSMTLPLSRDSGMGVQISGQTFGELRIVPDMHTRKVR